MGGHALRGAVTAWLTLIALQTIGTAGGSGRVASFFADADSLVKRALDPNVPAIPDRRAPSVGTPTADLTNPFLASALTNSAPSKIFER